MSLLPLEFHPEAADETVAAYHWYATRSPAAAARFLEEIDGAMARVRADPTRVEKSLNPIEY
jgi:plasmid stabilization system protein ParE